MSIKVRCPYCDHVNSFADTLAGKCVRCKACAESIDVPEEEDEDAPRSRRKAGGFPARPASMAHRAHDEDEEDEPPAIGKRTARKPGASGGVPILVWVLVGLGALMLLSCGGCGAVFYMLNTNERLIIGRWQSNDLASGKTLEFDKGGMVRVIGPDQKAGLPASYRLLDSQTLELTWTFPWETHSERFKLKVGWREMTLTDERGKTETFTRL